MANLTKPLEAVMNVLSLVAGFIAQGISGIRKKFTQDDFLPVVYVSIKDLKVDPKYQRLINLGFIKKAKEFDPLLVKPLSVFQRPNGDKMVVDGQHTTVLAATYVENPEEFKLPCQIQVHPSDFTIAQCEKAEAAYFKRFNSLRNTVSAVAKLRADIAQGAKYALDTEESFQSLNVHVEGIGAPDDGINSVYGYDKLKVAIGKYGNTLVKTAVDAYKTHNTADGNKWTQPLNGSMILGLAATYHFLDNYVGDGKKREGFLQFLNDRLAKRSVDKYILKTAGPQMDVLILENILDQYNNLVEQDVLDYPSIGMEKENSKWKAWKEDPIHGAPKDEDSED
jgi:hypothetical protein|tara:strand:+ start:140 stop:1153 length:1014 start_codon:yes stop_codon:yes gene_type:complete